MHLSSLDKMKAFRQRYLAGREGEPLEIIDLGSVSIGGNYRQLFDARQWSYTGVDLVEGENVDLVLSDPYSWIEIPTASVDVFVSGQAFEHIAFFWRTMQEVDRILKPGGLCCIIAPSGGPEHRYPVDCWRFYPDGFRALAHYVDFEIVEAYTDWEPEPYADDSHQWADTVLIARKTDMQASADAGMDGHIYNREIDDQAPDSLSLIISRLPKQSHVLELGPATGYLTRYMQKNLGCQVDAVEISPEMAEQAAPYCRQMVVADLESTDLVEQFQGRRYDRIVIADVLEHLIHRCGVLRACRKLLADDGRLLVSVPNITHAAIVANLLNNRFEYTDEGLLDHTHLHLFTRESIVRLLRRADFSVECIDVVERLPEDTEIADSFTGLPAVVQQTILKRSDALTYQFVITCAPGANGSDGGPSPEADTLRKTLDLRRQFLKQQNDLIAELYEKSGASEKLALERLSQIDRLIEEQRALRKSYRDVEALFQQRDSAYRHAEKLAVERLEQITSQRKTIEDYRTGLATAQKLAFDRLDQITKASQDIERLTGELEQIRRMWWFRIRRRIVQTLKPLTDIVGPRT